MIDTHFCDFAERPFGRNLWEKLTPHTFTANGRNERMADFHELGSAMGDDFFGGNGETQQAAD